MTTMDEQIKAMRAIVRAYVETVDKAAAAVVRWAQVMHAEAMWRALERHMRDWSMDERDEFQRLVRRLHDQDPELSLTDCMLMVGAAMEACR